MDKLEFIKKYRRRILLGAFNDDLFLCRDDIELLQRDINTNVLKDFYCPWYYLDDQEKNFEEGLCDIHVKAMKIADSAKIDMNQKRRMLIENYQRNQQISLEPVPIATDIATSKTLILDSNKTCIALYRNCLENNTDVNIPFIEIKGINLESVIGDFHIINRP